MKPSKSVIFLNDWKPLISYLSDTDKILFLELFMGYEFGQEQVCNSSTLLPIWLFIKSQMDNMANKYNENIVERNKRNGKLGGRKPKENNPNNPVGLSETQITYNSNNNSNINNNINNKIEDPAQIFQEAEILETTEYKPENGKEKGCAQKESFLPIEELENRFKNYEFQTWEFLMRNFAITREEYDVGVDLFLFEQKDNLEREYSDIHKHLKSFIKLNIKNIKSQNNGKPRTVAGIKVETIKRTFEALNADTD